VQPEDLTSRTLVSPLTGLSFLVIGVTGTLMLFHVRLPGMVILHELGGALFVVMAILHVKTNWRPLIACCGKRTGRIALGIGAAILGLFLLLGLGHEEHHRQRGEPIHTYGQQRGDG
jgi:hypothetical protein